MLFLLITLILFNSFGVNNQNLVEPSEKRDILEYQLQAYFNEFIETDSPIPAWFIYQILSSNIDEDVVISILYDIKNNNSFLINIIDCLLDDFYHEEPLYISYVQCVDIPTLYLSLFYDSKYSSDQILNFFDSEAYNLDAKHLSHYNFLIGKDFDFNQAPDYPSIEVLDFYYFEFINKSDHSLDAYFDNFLSQIDNNHFIGLSNSSNILLLQILINGLFKSDREYDVFRVSHNINDFKDFPISETSMRMFRYVSFSSYFSGYYQYDIDLYRNSIIPLSQFFQIEEEMKARLDFGVSLFQMGNLQSSLEQLEKVYETIDAFDDYRYQSALLNNLGIVYYYTGYFEDYLQLIITGLEFANNKDIVELEIDFLYNLHIYHKKIENWNVAFQYLEQINEKVHSIGDIRNLALVNQSYATFYRDGQKNIEKSLKHLLTAEYYARKAMYSSLLTSITAELINTYISIGDYDKALVYIHRLYDDAVSRNDHSIELYSYVKFANLYLDIGDNETAFAYIDTIKTSESSQLLFSKSQALLTKALARYKILNDENHEAINLLSVYANDLISRIKNSSEIQSGQLIFGKEYLDIFNLLVEQLIVLNDRETATYWMDEVKNLSSASFYNNPALKASILSERELVLDFALRNRIERLRHQLRSADENKRVQLNTLLTEAISEQNALRRKVLHNLDLEPVNLKRLRRQLGRSDVILYFSLFNEQLYISTISSGSFNIHRVTFSDKDLYRVEQIVNSLSSDRVKLTELAWLKSKLFDGIEVSDRYTNYYIIPDGFLYHIPFEILPVDNVASDYSYGKATYLIERASISYSNSLKDLKTSLSHRPQRNYALDFVGFGITHFNNPESQLLPGRYLPALPLAEKEVKEISTILSSLKNNVYLDSETATERRFREKTGNSRILHFASHSEVFENDPLYSVIYLNQEMDESENRSGDANSDGFVYAYELFQLDLTSEMVMMNSCESGSGNYIQGSGIVGFSRAFNYAGVPTLVMNLWSVRDRSAYHLSVSFYEYLNQGYSKNEAMQKAKIDYINKHNSNPTNWGSFVIYGNIDPIVPSRTPWIAALVLIFIASVSLIVAWFRLPGKIKSRLQ